MNVINTQNNGVEILISFPTKLILRRHLEAWLHLHLLLDLQLFLRRFPPADLGLVPHQSQEEHQA